MTHRANGLARRAALGGVALALAACRDRKSVV